MKGDFGMKILWLSRHELNESQLNDLKRIYGTTEIKNVSMMVKSAEDVIEAGKDCDILAVVLPPQVIAELIKKTDKPVIRAINNRMPTGKKVINPRNGCEEDEYVFQHGGWERVIKVEVVTEKL